MNTSGHTQQDIPCYTLPMLTSRNDDQERPLSGPLFRDFLIAQTDSVLGPFRHPCRIAGIVIGVCTAGRCRVVSNLNELTLEAGAMCISSPKNVLQIIPDRDFRADVLIISPEFIKQIHINTQLMMPLMLSAGNRQFFTLTESDRTALHYLIYQIEREIQVATETHFTTEIICGLISATIYKIGDILTRHANPQPDAAHAAGRNRAEAYFQQFIQLLGKHYKSERSVGFYARQMCITPKYLTTLIKRISNRSVSEWIDDYVIMEAKTLLRYSSMSVQEVAYQLNFPNQSFFGSYFKRLTGMSPSQYKQQ